MSQQQWQTLITSDTARVGKSLRVRRKWRSHWNSVGVEHVQGTWKALEGMLISVNTLNSPLLSNVYARSTLKAIRRSACTRRISAVTSNASLHSAAPAAIYKWKRSTDSALIKLTSWKFEVMFKNLDVALVIQLTITQGYMGLVLLKSF